MLCHYCDRDADVAVEKEGLKVGLCEDHFQDRMTELADSEALADIDDGLDVDSPE